MSFYEWLQRQSTRDTPTGDLARDAARVPQSRDLPDTLSAWDAFLRGRGACPEALSALRLAWRSYQSYRVKHPEG